MGCTQSKIENEETVSRCKDRKLFMKDAVSARNAFAAAHSAYAMSLKNTGAALSDYASGEAGPLPASTSSATDAAATLPSVSHSSYETLPPPPPPLPNYPSAQLQRSSTMPEFSIPKPDHHLSEAIIEEENEGETENESHRGNTDGKFSGELEGEHLPPPPSPPAETDRAPPPPPPSHTDGMSMEFFFPSMGSVPGPSLAEVDLNRIQREEIGRQLFEERSRRSGKAEAEAAERGEEPPPQPTQIGKGVKKVNPNEGKRVGKVASSVHLMHIFSELDDCFLKASESAHGVSKMLEANRLHYHSNFADNRGHIDHSARVLRVITWNRSFRGLPNADEGKDDFDSEEHETHATVLDRMLAWEKKLYDEVKAGEQMKVEYQRKVVSLKKLKKRGSRIEVLEKTKAALSHLHTRYIVDMQSMDSTVSEISRLRDEQLYPRLVALLDGMATMWGTMRIHHENQSKIVTALRYVDISRSSTETSEHHHGRTVQLWNVVQEWQSQFDKLMTHQKEYIKALNNWLKLNLIPIDNNLKEKVSSPQRPQNPRIQALLNAWQDHLEKFPDELVRTALNNFAAAISTIISFQLEELRLKKKCEDTQKELSRRTRQFEDWYHKYTQQRTPPDEMDPERAQNDELITEKQSVVEAVKKRLEEEEEALQRQCIQVREKSLASLRTHLPELFRALSDFALDCSDSVNIRPTRKPHNVNESS